MKRAPLWIGILALWMALGTVAAWLLLTPADQPATAAKPELARLDEPLPSETEPLQQPLTGLPEIPGLPERTAVESAEETAAPELAETPAIQPAKSERTGASDPDRTDISVAAGESTKTELSTLGALRVNGTLKLPAGEVAVRGDVSIVQGGKLEASQSTLVFDGADQTLEGELSAKRVILRGGTKRIRAGTWGTNGSENAEPGKAGLYVEAGTTLIIEKGGKWNTPNPYGFQIAGNLVIDGGDFVCRFSNGNGTDRGEKSWLEGSTLTIYAGKFVGNGDADFSGATINIHDGALEINDDIWNSGDALNIYGGYMRNTTGGGMFSLNGAVNVRGGKLQVYQSGGRSLRIIEAASVYCSGGEISINGSPTRKGDGILLGSNATLPDLVINTTTGIHKDSAPSAFLSVAGDLKIAKGHKFEANGFNVIASYLQTDESGEYVP